MEVSPFSAILREARDSSKRCMCWYMSTYKYYTIEGTSVLASFPI